MDFIYDENPVIRVMYLFVMLSNTFVVWAGSIFWVFVNNLNSDRLGEMTAVVALVGRLCSIILSIYSKCKVHEITTGEIIIKAIFWDTVILFYFALTYSNLLAVSSMHIAPGILIGFILFMQAKKIYKEVKLLIVSLLHQTKLKIADLMIIVTEATVCICSQGKAFPIKIPFRRNVCGPV